MLGILILLGGTTMYVAQKIPFSEFPLFSEQKGTFECPSTQKPIAVTMDAIYEVQGSDRVFRYVSGLRNGFFTKNHVLTLPTYTSAVMAIYEDEEQTYLYVYPSTREYYLNKFQLLRVAWTESTATPTVQVALPGFQILKSFGSLNEKSSQLHYRIAKEGFDGKGGIPLSLEGIYNLKTHKIVQYPVFQKEQSA